MCLHSVTLSTPWQGSLPRHIDLLPSPHSLSALVSDSMSLKCMYGNPCRPLHIAHSTQMLLPYQDDDDGDGSESEFQPGSEEASESEDASDLSDAAESGDDEADANDRAASRRKGATGLLFSYTCPTVRTVTLFS
jgi:hypothetical protein